MAKNRMINTKFWSDTFIVDELNPLDRYLFLYLLTNEKTNSIWIYEISIRTLAFETWIDKDTLLKMIERLDSKVLYIDWWICFKNFIRHQSPNPNQQKWMERVWKEEVSTNIKEKLKPFAKDFKGFIKDSLLNLTLPNLTKLNSKEGKISNEIIIPQNNNLFNTFNKVNIINKYEITEKELDIEIEEFINYWTAIIRKWKKVDIWKQLWETKETFEINKRLSTWLRNTNKWKQKVFINTEDEERKRKLAEIEKKKKALFNNL